jgi:hypothetical protein
VSGLLEQILDRSRGEERSAGDGMGMGMGMGTRTKGISRARHAVVPL